VGGIGVLHKPAPFWAGCRLVKGKKEAFLYISLVTEADVTETDIMEYGRKTGNNGYCCLRGTDRDLPPFS
jgi:hypothetical protein